MKEAILKILIERTQIDSRYTGGDETSILSIINSEDVSEDNKEKILGYLADEIIKELQ